MKKLIFAALLATVALGGAYAAEYSTGPAGAGRHFTCNGADSPTCKAQFPAGAYLVPSSTISQLPELTYEPI